MKINFAALSDEERATQFSALDNVALDVSLNEAKAEASALFALPEADLTVDHAETATALVTSMGLIEAEQDRRKAVAAEAAAKFAAAKATFSAEDEVETSTDEPVEASAGAEEDEEDESEEDESTDADADADAEGEVVTAAAVNHTGSQRLPATSAARKVGAKAKRPAVAASSKVVITASADIPNVPMGSVLDDMGAVAKAMQARVKGFAPFNKHSARTVNQETGGAPKLSKFGVASFSVPFEGEGAALTASSGTAAEYSAMKEAVTAHVQRIEASLGLHGNAAMTAAMAWCAPSEVVYNWIADFVVDGLKTLPEIPAPRGGVMLTEGPQLLQDEYGTDAAVDGFGFGGTETEMEAGYIKTCETIVCPEFVDHRLDFDGYCWKIPILTEHAFPELVADAMRASDVLYAHKINRRTIRDILNGSTPIEAQMPYGGSVLDTLEALVQVAVKERRWWNLGENAVMEVTLPQHVREIFKFDMARRSGLALNDVATDQKIAAYFANHRLAVDYVSDFDSLHTSGTPTAAWPNSIRAIIYPAGTWVQAKSDVINLSAVYDAASLAENEYTGVFYEQGIKTIRRGYRSHVVEIPVCTAGASGANVFTCDAFFAGSF